MGVTSDETLDTLDGSLVNLVAGEVLQVQVDLFDVCPVFSLDVELTL